jgi:long-subunit acyl-CoA synthetase (AMP-forming)
MMDIELKPGTPAAFAQPTVCAAFQATVAAGGDTVALRTKGDATKITWRELGDRVKRYAGGFVGLGVKPADTVAILMLNRPEFNVLDAAALHVGAVPFSIYVTSTIEQIHYFLEDSGAKVAVTERAFAGRMREAASGTAVEKIIVVDGDVEGMVSLAQLEATTPPASTSRPHGAPSPRSRC